MPIWPTTTRAEIDLQNENVALDTKVDWSGSCDGKDADPSSGLLPSDVFMEGQSGGFAMARLPVCGVRIIGWGIAAGLVLVVWSTKPSWGQNQQLGTITTNPAALQPSEPWPTTGYPAFPRTAFASLPVTQSVPERPAARIDYDRLAMQTRRPTTDGAAGTPTFSPAFLANPASDAAVPPDANLGSLPPVERLSMASFDYHETNNLGTEEVGCEHCGRHGCRRSWLSCIGGSAELLFLRPGNLDVLYAVEQTGCGPGATPTGPQGIVGPDMSTGVRVNAYLPMSECSRIVAGYTWFQSGDTDRIVAAPNTVLDLVVAHPNIESCGVNSLVSSASFDVNFQFVDLAYQHLLCGGCDWGLSYLAGVRYARLSQEFSASQITGVAVGLTDVTSNLSYDGIGLRLGLRGETHSAYHGLFLYASGDISFLSGQHQAVYQQTSQFLPNAAIAREFDDFRLTTILETELGVGWQSTNGHVRLSCGFQTAGWYNTLLTQTFLDGMRGPDTNDDFVTFSGMVARLEFLR